MKRSLLLAGSVWIVCVWHFNRANDWPHPSWMRVAAPGERVAGEIVDFRCTPALDLMFTRIGGGCWLGVSRWERAEPEIAALIGDRWIKDTIYTPISGLARPYYLEGTYRWSDDPCEEQPEVLPPPTIYDSDQCHPASYLDWFCG